MTLLSNTHISPETAYVVEDYPYGFKLRCKIRYWLEFHPKRGFRFMSQTTNPKRAGESWNKPRASTYYRFGAALYFDESGHVKCTGLSEYSDGAECKTWKETYGTAVPEEGQDNLKRWVAAKVAYDENRSKGDPLSVGLREAHKAFAAAEEEEIASWKA